MILFVILLLLTNGQYCLVSNWYGDSCQDPPLPCIPRPSSHNIWIQNNDFYWNDQAYISDKKAANYPSLLKNNTIQLDDDDDQNVTINGQLRWYCNATNQNPVSKNPFLDCNVNVISKLSLGNKFKNQGQMEMQDFLNCATIILMIIFLKIFKRDRQAYSQQLNQTFGLISEYSILVKGLPTHFSKNKIKNMFSFCVPTMKFEIQDISMVYDLDDINEQKKKLLQLLNYKQKLINQKDASFDKVIQLEAFIQTAKIQLTEYEKIAEKYGQFTGNVFLTFDTEYEKYMVMKFFNRSIIDFYKPKVDSFFKYLIIYHKYIQKLFMIVLRVSLIFIKFNIIQPYILDLTSEVNDLIWNLEFIHPAEPQDVIWESLYQKQYKTKILRSFIFFIIISLEALILYQDYCFFQHMKMNKHHKSDSILSVQDFLQIILNIHENLVMILLTNYLLKHNAYEDIPQYQYNCSVYSILVMNLNTIIFPIINEMYWNSLNNQEEFYKLNLFNFQGIIYKNTFILIFAQIFFRIYQCLDLKWVQNQYEKLKLINYYQKNTYSQFDLNLLFQGPESDLVAQVSMATSLMIQLAFIMVISPLFLFFALISLIIAFIMKKYTLIYRDSLKSPVQTVTIDSILNHTDIIPFVFACSNFFIYYQITEQFTYPMTIGLILSFLDYIIPYNYFFKYAIQNTPIILTYNEALQCGQIKKTYNDCNPMPSINS